MPRVFYVWHNSVPEEDIAQVANVKYTAHDMSMNS